MSDLNNLFWFGKKELTQDAILMWVFKNYDESDLKDIANDLIGHFSLGRSLRKDEEITNLRGKLQYKEIDVAIEFYLKSNTDEGWYYLIVENKTYSYLHNNQIKKYLKLAFNEFDDKWHIKNRPNTKIKLIYFKTTSLNNFDKTELFKESYEILDEYKNTKNSSFNPTNDVRIIDLKYFYENIIYKYIKSSNFMLNEYSNFIFEKYKAMIDGQSNNNDVSKYFIGYPSVWEDTKDEKSIDLSFEFFGSLFSKFENKYKNHCDFWWDQHSYYFFKCYDDTSKNQSLPIVEIRSRDFYYDEEKNFIKVEVHLVNYTKWFDELYKKNKEEYLKMTRKWANYLKEKYSKTKILDIFSYESSPRKENQRQLGKILYEKEGKMSYSELIEIINNLIETQKLIDNELKGL